MKTCVSGLNALFWGTKVEKHPFYSIGPKMIYGSVTERFANLVHVKRRKLVFPAWMRYIGAPKLWSIHSTPLYPKWCLGVFQRCKTSVSGLNALFRGTKVAKHPFYSIGPKMMYVSVAEHLDNLLHVKRWKLVFRAWMHYFGAPKLRSILLLH
jgi:acid stress-induced BolA-like protein IbaG/YrbA